MTDGLQRRAAGGLLGIECGGTKSTALLADAGGWLLQRIQAGPANLRLLTDAQLLRHFRTIASALPRPDAIAIGMAGARTEVDRARICRAAARVWGEVPCYATNDLETALMAAAGPPVAADRPAAIPRVLILSGTGSCCFGRAADGRTAKVGGWGHILGDKGSGFEIGLRALKAVVYYLDRDGEWSALGQRILRKLQLNEPNDLINWAQQAGKTDIAALAVEVFAARARRDPIASDILEGAAHSLAKDAAACARRLAGQGTRVQFILSGSVLIQQPRFADKVTVLLKQLWPRAVVTPLRRESVWGAVELARQFNVAADVRRLSSKRATRSSAGRRSQSLLTSAATDVELVRTLALSPTEERNPRSMTLDKLPLGEAIALMLREDARIPAALLAERATIERAVRLIVRSFQRGGRLFYVGAGTSGRLGVLDASECPPTFRTPPELVQGIIAGGQRAIWEAVEGAEDDADAGARALAHRGVTRRDTVVGIAASGRTPFVWGALGEAKRRGAGTVLLCFNPHLKIPRALRPTLVLAPKIGPEILTGSTRLKAGTATKLVLNIFTTLAMVRMGKVLGNLMIDVKASNVKLRDRAARMVRELTGADDAAARAALERCAWQVRPACARLKRSAT